MCVPTTVMTGMSVLGSALGMANSLSNQKAQAEQARQAQAQAVQNAETAWQNAKQALADGEREKEEIRLEQKALQSQKAVQYGAGNVSLAGGSPLNVLADMAEQGESLAQQAGENARRQAENYERQAQNYLGKSSPYNPFSAADTVFSGISSISGSLSGLGTNTKNGSTKRGPNYF